MKRTKKLFSLALAFIMAMALMTPAFAAETEANNGTNKPGDPNYKTGTITVSNPVIGETYTIYRLLDLESYNNTNKAFSYKVNSAWTTFFNQDEISGTNGYVTIDGQGYVTWKAGASAADFAAKAIAYAKANTIASAADPVTAAEGVSVVFSGLDLGYYLIDSSMGTLCALDTTNNEVTVYEKNGAPTSDKKVQEDSTGNYGSSNTADIIDTIYYQATITVPGGKTTGDADDSSVDTTNPGAQKYILHDKMDAGLKFGSVTGITLNGTTVATDKYIVKTTGLADTTCAFEVEFTQAFCDTLKKDDKIVVSYTATFDGTIVADQAYKNTAWLTYGEDGGPQTPDSTTTTKTFDVDVFKYALIDTTETPLEGAVFYLYKMVPALDENGNKIADKTIKSYAIAQKGANNNIYTLTGWVNEAYNKTTGEAEGNAVPDAATQMISPTDGKFTIHGLDADTYYLNEAEAPDGYNKLAADKEFTITDASLSGDNSQVKVENKTGLELPSTGGIGTTIFYVVGGVLMAGAAILLITKKKMSNEQ